MWIDRLSPLIPPLITLLLFSWAPRSHGQPKPASSHCESDASCARLAEQGKAALQAEQYETALAAYQAAYALRQDPKLLYNLARTAHRAGRLADAVLYYDKYLREGIGEPQAQRDKAAQHLEAASAAIETKKKEKPTPVARGEAGALTPTSPSDPTPAPPGTRARGTLPRWRIGVGVALMGTGLTLVGFGISGMLANGSCKQMTAAMWGQPMCLQTYDTQAAGSALLGTGSAAILAGILTLAIPTKEGQAQRAPAANVAAFSTERM